MTTDYHFQDWEVVWRRMWWDRPSLSLGVMTVYFYFQLRCFKVFTRGRCVPTYLLLPLLNQYVQEMNRARLWWDYSYNPRNNVGVPPILSCEGWTGNNCTDTCPGVKKDITNRPHTIDNRFSKDTTIRRGKDNVVSLYRKQPRIKKTRVTTKTEQLRKLRFRPYILYFSFGSLEWSYNVELRTLGFRQKKRGEKFQKNTNTIYMIGPKINMNNPPYPLTHWWGKQVFVLRKCQIEILNLNNGCIQKFTLLSLYTEENFWTL